MQHSLLRQNFGDLLTEMNVKRRRGNGLFYPTNIASLVAGYDAERTDLVTEVGSGIDTLSSIDGGFDMSQSTDSLRPAYITSEDGKRAFDCDGRWLSGFGGIVDLSADFDIWFVSKPARAPMGGLGTAGGGASGLKLESSGSSGHTYASLHDSSGSLVSGITSVTYSTAVGVHRAWKTGTQFGAETVGVSTPEYKDIGTPTFDAAATQTSYIGRSAGGTVYQNEIRGAYWFDRYLGASGDAGYENMKAFSAARHGAVVSFDSIVIG